MPDTVRAQVHLRVDAALDLIRSIIQSGRTDINLPEHLEVALASILIEFWHGKGAEWAR